MTAKMHNQGRRVVSYLLIALFGAPTTGQDLCRGNANFTLTCPSYQKCKNNCGLIFFEANNDCSCDRLCRLYGDCCVDFQDNCPNTAKKSLEITPRFSSGGKCRTIHHDAFRTLMFLAKCDPAWADDDIRTLCMDELSSMVSIVPVTDVTTSLSYNNIYCAVCNHLELDKIVLWNVKELRCIERIPANSTDDQILEYIKNGLCGTGLTWPDDVAVHKRRCAHFLNSECQQQNCSEELQEKCMMPTFKPVSANGRQSYHKNEFCAVCSGYEVDQLKCLRNLMSVFVLIPHLGSFSFSALADISDRVYQFRSRSTNKNSCNDNQTVTGGYCNTTAVYNQKDTNYLFANSESDEWLGILSLVCISASILCLVVRLGLQIPVRSYHNLAGKTQFSFSVSLLVALMAFLGGPFATGVREVCRFLGMVMHWAFLASFFWMNVTAVDMWQVFRPTSLVTRSLKTQKKLFRKFCLYAWLVPLAIVLAGYSLDLAHVDSELRPYYGHRICWITQKYSLILFFGAPLAFVIVTNTVLYATTFYNLRRAMKMASVVREEDNDTFGYRFGIFVKLFVLMGITWVSAFVAALVDNEVMWGIYTVLTATQGVYVSLATICTRQVKKDLFGSKKGSSQSPSENQGKSTKTSSQ